MSMEDLTEEQLAKLERLFGVTQRKDVHPATACESATTLTRRVIVSLPPLLAEVRRHRNERGAARKEAAEAVATSIDRIVATPMPEIIRLAVVGALLGLEYGFNDDCLGEHSDAEILSAVRERIRASAAKAQP